MLRYIVPCLTGGLVLVVVLAVGADESRKPAITAAQLEDAPLTISVSTVGRFGSGRSWHLSINSAGQAELTIDTIPDGTRKRFQVSKEQMAEFRKLLANGRFFELKGEYGDQVPDGSERSITVTAGRHTHTVKVHYLRTSTAAERGTVREASGAVRLLVLVRGWFDDASAVDLGKYDEADLAAAKE